MLKLENISFSFNNNLVLSNIIATCDQNEFITFIGPSGCGKTTLLNIIAGIYKPQKGVLHNPYKNLSYVFQHDSLLPWLNVIQNILLPVEIKNKTISNSDKISALNLLNELGLQDTELLYPSELSGGMKKRVEIARALITQPDLLILDEPFSSLDLLTRERLNVLIKNIYLVRKISVVLVTHSIEEACFLSSKIYVLSDKPSSIISIFENKIANKPVEYFFLNEFEEETENKIRKLVSNLWNEKNQDTSVSVKTKKMIDNQDERKLNKNFIFNLLVPIELFVLFIFLELIKKKFNISDYFFPLPSSLLLRFVNTIKSGMIFQHLFQTILESLSGFFIAFFLSIILGYILSRNSIIYKLIMPYLISFNAIPSIAIAPFLILWFGFSIISKILISVIVIFFPMLINNITAFQNIQQQFKNLLTFYKPDLKERFLRFELPGSLLYIFAAIKVSITLSIIGAVVGEFQAGSLGLGSLILIAKANFDIELMFVGLVWLIILGLSYFWLANFIYKIIIKRKS